MSITEELRRLQNELPSSVTLVAVSKTKPISAMMEAYNCGQRDFGENKVQELAWKMSEMPADVRWHMIGHLQRNKVKYIVSFVHLIHSIDSLTLLEEVEKQARKINRTIDCLLQLHIASEETKFGLSEEELDGILSRKAWEYLCIRGLMGMATFTDQTDIIRGEFSYLKRIFEKYAKERPKFDILSMGMSGDYSIAIEEGSTLIRVGSSIFGDR